MKAILKGFTVKPLFNACAAMLEHLHIQFNEVTRTPVPFASLYSTPLTKALQEVMTKVENTYFIGTVDEASLTGHVETKDAADVTYEASEGRYAGMMIFAVNINMGESLTRTEMATLTRGFNRIAAAQPVILFIKYGHELALATCERSDYTQQWRDGEKLGKVSILRGINCEQPHRGHLDILESIGDKAYPTFEELYKHWMQVFSSELLTKKFYSELSDWYAWAVQVARFPNDLNTNEDDDKFNHESCIRLITRLIFVWFLKQKHLIPEEFFDERYIREHFIDEFNPHARKTLLYDAEQSKYYRLILQNLFFAMLNCPIVADGEDVPNNRRFRDSKRYGFYNTENDINNLMRYKDDFKEGGADEFVALANNSVPFLNGGLFDCLDDKPNKMYYDGFSEYKRSLEQLYLPDWLFFGDEVGRSVDLSQWYGDAKKKKVSARGIIDILKRYNFTIEENTPLDQEVSLDPELLGKAFENLLASYNPETKTSARKQTGSFYTPREIVLYMVDESLVAHLKRTCGDELETEYRRLLSYATDETTLTEEQRQQVMHALYNCRVLDPACGSGAFPMGVLQQMVHILRQLDPTNEMWKEFMIDLAIEQSRVAFSADAEEERRARLADIEEAFNRNINDPDYARKLYLIEHCIYGVDIQPIAVQISKLRFFISLVVDQKPTTDATQNFGIRPLPNLESKFVAANTLIPIEYDATLVDSNPEVRQNKDRLKELNHKCFLVKRKAEKDRLKRCIKETRAALARAIEDTGFVGHSEAELLAGWDMFDQNASSSYFDAEWMFGVRVKNKEGFDIVIGNPPYIDAKEQLKKRELSMQRDALSSNKRYKTLYQKWDLYIAFMEMGIRYLCAQNGIFTMIVPYPLTNQLYAKKMREMIVSEFDMLELVDLNGTKVFENATVSNCIPFISAASSKLRTTIISNINKDRVIYHAFEQNYSKLVQDEKTAVWNVTQEERKGEKHKGMHVLGDFCYISVGMVLNADEKVAKGEFVKADLISESQDEIHCKNYIEGKDLERFCIKRIRYLEYGTKRSPGELRRPTFDELYTSPKLLINALGEMKASVDLGTNYYCEQQVRMALLWKDLENVSNKSITSSIKKFSTLTRDEMERLSRSVDIRYLLGIINSKYASVLLSNIRGGDYHIVPEHIRNIPIPSASGEQQRPIIDLVNSILKAKEADPAADTKDLEDKIDLLVYHLYGLTYAEVLIVDPETPITRKEYES